MFQFIENLDQKTIDTFVEANKKSHFNQSYAFGQLKGQHGYIPHYVGLKQDGELVATALLLEKRLFKKFTYFYIPRGMIVDYHNFEVLDAFIQAIHQYCKARKAVFLKIDPDIALREIDDQGKEIPSENNEYALLEHFKQLGFTHTGFNVDFENAQPRFTFRLDVTQDLATIRKNFHSTTRKILNKEPQFPVYLGDESELPKFFALMHETANRANFTSAQDRYYHDFYQILHDAKMSDIYYATIQPAKLVEQTKQKCELLLQELEKTKNEGKRHDLQVQYQKLQKELVNYEAIAKEHDELTLSSIITVKYGNKAWTVHGGNNDLLRELNANYHLYYKIIEDMKVQGIEIIDFFGTTGNPDPSNPIYGIYLFKKRLGGDYIEFIGEFDYIYNRFMYNVYMKYAPKLRKLIKR